MISTKLPDTLILKPNVTEGMWYFVQAVTVNDSINCWAKILAAAKAIELGRNIDTQELLIGNEWFLKVI